MARIAVALLSLVFLGSALSQELVIDSMDGFNKFINNITGYDEVYLAEDLDFTGVSSFSPISNFKGTFDGQGHNIMNLKIESSETSLGFFESLGSSTTVRNLVIDLTCSVTSTISTGDSIVKAYIGSVVGYCEMCTLENIINSAEVKFNGYGFKGSLYVGGIIGYLYANSGSVLMKNLVNYGVVANYLDNTNPGNINIYTGGLAGHSIGIYKNARRLEYINCANFGSVISQSSNSLVSGTGGISGGCAGFPLFKSVFSAGSISVPEGLEKGAFVGTGDDLGEPEFDGSYVSSNLGINNYFGSNGKGYVNETNIAPNLTEETFQTLNQDKVWLYNPNKVSARFTVNDYLQISFDSEVILMPSLVSRDNYVFGGWFTDSDCQTPLTNYTIDKYTRLYGGWKYTIHFDPNGGEISVPTKNVIYTHIVGALPEPTRTGYNFVGWYSPLIENKLTEDYVYMFTENVTFLASWEKRKYVVSFDFGDGSPLLRDTVTYEDNITYPEDPTRYDYDFMGWNGTDEHGQNIIKMPPYDFTISALWKIKQYNVTFIYYEGKEETNLCDLYSEIEYPVNPTREGYVFIEWYPRQEAVPFGGISITAIWIRNNYTLTFDFNNGSEPISYLVTYGDPIELPSERPIKTGFSFNGWEPSDVTSMPPHDFTITARYATNYYALTFDCGNGTVISDSLNYNETVPYPKGMVREGYTFVKWDPDFKYMPDNSLYATALWAHNNYTITFLLNNPSGKETKVYHFEDDIVYPSEPVREGYVFYKWDQTYDKMPSRNVSVRAQWLSPEKFVSMTLNSNNITTEAKVNEVFGKYAADGFVIDSLEVVDGKTLLVLGFEDREKAKSFYEKLRASSDMKMVSNVDFLSRGIKSFSPVNYVSSLLNMFFLV